MSKTTAYLCQDKQGIPTLELYGLDFFSINLLTEIMILNGSDEIYRLRGVAGAHMSLGFGQDHATITMFGKTYQPFLAEMGGRLDFTVTHVDVSK